MATQKQSCLLLTNLPLELRERIYEFIVLPTTSIMFSNNEWADGVFNHEKLAFFPSGPNQEFKFQPFVQTCKQIYRECKDLFWKKAMLTFAASSRVDIIHQSMKALPALKNIRMISCSKRTTLDRLKSILEGLRGVVMCDRQLRHILVEVHVDTSPLPLKQQLLNARSGMRSVKLSVAISIAITNVETFYHVSSQRSHEFYAWEKSDDQDQVGQPLGHRLEAYKDACARLYNAAGVQHSHEVVVSDSGRADVRWRIPHLLAAKQAESSQ
jgi:hypothetical protein